jgi:cellobiose phosphorylase
MHGRSSKGDVAQNALRVVEQAIGEPLKSQRKVLQLPPRKKNPAAVALGKLGGKKGGRARAAKLSSEERKEIAQKAAKARWARSE